jgi:hypothetical protein
MAFVIPPKTKFATINLAEPPVGDDVSDPTLLANELSVHRAPLFTLGSSFERGIGERAADDFSSSSLVLMASCASSAPTFRDEEWLRLDRRVFMLYYAILMNGVPNARAATVASGGTSDEEVIVLHVSVVAKSYRPAGVVPPTVSAAILQKASGVVDGLVTAYGGTDYMRVRRGVGALVDAWRQGGTLDRLHGFVRALDGLMALPQGSSRKEFIKRLAVFALGTNISQDADILYRLRSFDEHLSDWPKELPVVPIADRPAFVANYAFYAEAVASFAFRTILGTSALLSLFRTDTDVQNFWAGASAVWTSRLHMDSELTRFHPEYL